MEDPMTGDPLFPPNFVTIHDLREQWLLRRQPQRLRQLEARRGSPPGRQPRRPPTPPQPAPSVPPPAQKDRRKRPEQELPRRETDAEGERGKASPRNEYDCRPPPANLGAARRETRVKEGSEGRQAIGSSGLKTSEKSSRGEYALFGAHGKAESASVKDQRKQRERELPRGETDTERERVRATPRNESDSRPTSANRLPVRRNTRVKEGSDGRQAIDSNGPKPSEKSNAGEYAGFGADGKSDLALVAAVSVVVERAEQVKKTEEWEKKKKKMKKKEKKKQQSNNRKEKGSLNIYTARAKVKGEKLEEGEVNEPGEEVEKEKFQRASSESQNVMPESEEVRVEAKPEKGAVHAPANEEKKKNFRLAGSESDNAMLESKEVPVEVESVAANVSQARAEGLKEQVWVVKSKMEIEGKSRNSSLQHDSKMGGSRRSYRGDHKGYGVIEGKRQYRTARKQSSGMVWVRQGDISDGNAGESSVKLVL